MRVKPIAKAGVTLGAVVPLQNSAMQDHHLRKSVGNRLRDIRKRRKWTQKDLATRVGVRFEQLNKYEMGLNMPPVEKLLAIAEICGTTVDFLLTGSPPAGELLPDRRLLRRFEAVQAFSPEDQNAVLALLDAMIVKHRVQGAIQPLDEKKVATRRISSSR